MSTRNDLKTPLLRSFSLKDMPRLDAQGKPDPFVAQYSMNKNMKRLIGKTEVPSLKCGKGVIHVKKFELKPIVKNKEGLIKVDGKVRRDHRFPLGNMDVVSIERTNQHFRMLLDVKGRFQPHAITASEASFKLCKIVKKSINKAKVPHIVTHDGRTIRFPHPDICINDSVKLNLATGEISSIVKFTNGATVMLSGGNNIGRIGILQSVEKHQGSFDIANVKDSAGHVFSTRISNVFVIGDGKTPAITIPKGEGLKLTLIEERDARMGNEAESAAEESDN